MKLLIEISDTLKQIADEEDAKTFSHIMWQAILMNAVKYGQPIPDDCEILTKEAYEDLCARASMSEQEKWLKGM